MIVVRPATLADLTTLRLFWEALVQEQARPYPRILNSDRLHWTQEMASRLEQQSHGHPFIYNILAINDETNTPVGSLIMQVNTRQVGTPNQFWIIDHLYVVPAERGRPDGANWHLSNAAVDYMRTRTPDIDAIELIAMAGDEQWDARGWARTMVRYHNTVDQAHRNLQARKKTGKTNNDIMGDVVVADEVQH